MKLERAIFIVSAVYVVCIVGYITFCFRPGTGAPSGGGGIGLFGGNRKYLFVDEDYSEGRVFNNTNTLTGSDINLDEYDYIINQPNKCAVGSNVFLLTLVTTQHKNFKERHAIRDTWASVKLSEGLHIVTVFLLAKHEDSRMMKIVQDESRKHQDIIEFDFQEAYLNLTLKSLMGFRWAVDYCPNAKYILKTDDDVFVNPYTLVNNLTGMPQTDFAYGYAYLNITPARNATDKWYTTFDMYKAEKYPPYLVGTGYVLSRDVVAKVHSLGSTKQYLSWEDVFVGICLDELHISLRHDWRFDTYSQYTKFKEPCSFHNLFTSHRKNPLRLRYMWKVYKKYRDQCIKLAAEAAHKDS